MRIAPVFLSVLGLLLTAVPSIFVFYGALSWKIHVQLMFIGMLLWFVFAPMWMLKKKAAQQ